MEVQVDQEATGDLSGGNDNDDDDDNDDDYEPDLEQMEQREREWSTWTIVKPYMFGNFFHENLLDTLNCHFEDWTAHVEYHSKWWTTLGTLPSRRCGCM